MQHVIANGVDPAAIECATDEGTRLRDWIASELALTSAGLRDESARRASPPPCYGPIAQGHPRSLAREPAGSRHLVAYPGLVGKRLVDHGSMIAQTPRVDLPTVSLGSGPESNVVIAAHDLSSVRLDPFRI